MYVRFQKDTQNEKEKENFALPLIMSTNIYVKPKEKQISSYSSIGVEEFVRHQVGALEG
jgi:hypothetical protein